MSNASILEHEASQVIIVGAGPVGLTLAIDLGRRGIRCVLLERNEAPQFLPKMERCNARSMEMFRRIGLADPIRKAGLPSHVPMDVFVILSMIEPPLLHLKYPSVDLAKDDIAQCQDGTMPLEPYQLISQYTLEPLLKSFVEKIPSVSVCYGCEFLSLSQGGTGVEAVVKAAGGNTTTMLGEYLVGCDGGASAVRRQLGIKLSGEGNIAEFRQALFRCDELFHQIPIGKGPGQGRHYHVADRVSSFLIMQDSTQHFTLHATVASDEEMKRQFETVVGISVRYEMLSCASWRQNLLLADNYRKQRVFLAGDAAHLVIPTGGLGMNTGVGDAFDLSWKLAATLQGWGGSGLLQSYEFERRQIGEHNVGASRYASLGRRRWRSQYRPELRENTAAGHAARANLIAVADVEQRKTNEMIGAELGYRYVDSPIIDNIPGGPEHQLREYIPTTWPGARLPHTWTQNGDAIQDLISDQCFTLLCLSAPAKGFAPLADAFAEFGAPFAALEIIEPLSRDVYGHDFILLRPDLHVVWRGNAPPADSISLARRATGHS